MHPKFQIHSTHIVLPSGSQIALDALNRFTPNREFWNLWNSDKLAVKRAGLGVIRERGQWQGYVREVNTGFSYSQADIHKLWTEQATSLAESEKDIPPVVIPAKTVSHIKGLPCYLHREYQVIATVCRNETYQLRLYCDVCENKTPGAIAWDTFDSDVVIRSIARAIQQSTPQNETSTQSFLDELKNVEDWV